MENLIFYIFKISFIQVAYALGLIIGCGLLLGIMERKSNEMLQRSFGWKGIIVTGLIGTTIHELGHLVMCLIFRHNVKDVKLLRIKESRQDGMLGYVKHSYNPNSLYQNIGNFFIGIGPIILGSLSMFIAMKLLMSKMFNNFYSFLLQQYSYITGFDNSFFIVFKNVFLKLWQELFKVHNLLSLNFWIFIFVVISISSHIALSKPDIKGSISGIISIYSLSVILNIIFKISNVNINYVYSKILLLNIFTSTLLFVAISFSFITLLINFVIYLIKRCCM